MFTRFVITLHFCIAGNFPESYVEIEVDGQDEDDEKDLASRAKLENVENPRKAGPKPSNVWEELLSTEQDFIAELLEVRDAFFPKLRYNDERKVCEC